MPLGHRGGAATPLPLMAIAQQRMPLVEFLNSASLNTCRFKLVRILCPD
jgi:hypothetical protein